MAKTREQCLNGITTGKRHPATKCIRFVFYHWHYCDKHAAQVLKSYKRATVVPVAECPVKET